MKFVKYPKTLQFRDIVSSINNKPCYSTENENTRLLRKPIIRFNGTVKLHGTNAAICYSPESDIYIQSRNQKIKLGQESHFGFSEFVYERKEVLYRIFKHIYNKHDINPNNFTISIYGEWAGSGIQKGVAISNIEKSFFIFAIKISNNNSEGNSLWIDCSTYKDVDSRIYNINDFKTFEIDIDFENPKDSLDLLNEYTLSVEEECPVAKEFGFSGIGEGIVWFAQYDGNNHLFKTKGEKHSSSKVKKVELKAPKFSEEKLNTINQFVEYTITDSRFEQALKEVFKDEPIDIKKLGEVMKWISNDVLSEESETLLQNGLTIKDVNSKIFEVVRKKFFTYFEK